MSKAIEFKSKTKNPKIPQVFDISPDEVNGLRTTLRLVDVRRPDEWVGEFGHIPEAVLMTLDTLPQRLNELPKDQTIVFICRSGNRSAQAAAFAQQNGYTHVYNMQGGMVEWTNKNFPAEERNGG